MPKIQFVYFDLDDTILDHKRAQDLALEDLCGTFEALRGRDVALVKAAYQKVNGRVWKEYADGTRDKEGTRTGRFCLLFEAMNLTANAEEAASRYLDAYERHWEYIENAWWAYSKIAERLPTGVLTNGFAETQRKKLAKFPELTRSFSAIVISEEEGALKPALSLFEVATKRAGFPAGAIAYVGDSLRSDIVGGLAAGWQVFWYTQSPQEAPPGVPCFGSWEELPALLEI